MCGLLVVVGRCVTCVVCRVCGSVRVVRCSLFVVGCAVFVGG